MKCPRCPAAALEQRPASGNTLLDRCSSCSGLWLDKGEIYFLVADAKALHGAFTLAYKTPDHGDLKCPRCEKDLLRVKLEGGLQLDACRLCGGNWLDRGELESLDKLLRRPLQGPVIAPPGRGMDTRDVPVLPSLALRSVAVLGGLYAALAGLFVAVAFVYQLDVATALLGSVMALCLNFLISPFLLDLSLRWLHHFRWIELSELPPHLAAFIEAACKAEGIPVPSIGLIDDGAPNAFTYGHVPGNARLVITRGILELLDDEESEAVAAHELGHIVHWDMLVMTAAALVPMLFYAIYRAMMRRSPRSSSRKSKGEGGRLLIALAAFVLYKISQYLVLFLSRTRELYADRYAGERTGKPDKLASGLVKVAYGLAAKGDEAAGSDDARAPEAAKALGIFDPGTARALAAVTQGGATATEAMRWDRWNPWAWWYELSSTHPLTARRLEHLGHQAEAMGRAPYAKFNDVPDESYWDDFLLDVLVDWLPWLTAAAGFAAMRDPWHALIGGCAGYLVKLWYCYPAVEPPEASVAGLLKQVKVSGVRGIPAKLAGTVIGRGVPGHIISEDVVVRDATGFMFLDYRQPLDLLQWIFALTRVGGMQGQAVTATGWYRRAPTPFLEVRRIEYPGGSSTCRTLEARYIACLAVLAFAGSKAFGMW